VGRGFVWGVGLCGAWVCVGRGFCMASPAVVFCIQKLAARLIFAGAVYGLIGARLGTVLQGRPAASLLLVTTYLQDGNVSQTLHLEEGGEYSHMFHFYTARLLQSYYSDLS